jgi:hypothetical protein
MLTAVLGLLEERLALIRGTVMLLLPDVSELIVDHQQFVRKEGSTAGSRSCEDYPVCHLSKKTVNWQAFLLAIRLA